MRSHPLKIGTWQTNFIVSVPGAENPCYATVVIYCSTHCQHQSSISHTNSGNSKRCGFCPPDMPDFKQLLEDSDDQLFERILSNPYHTLYQQLPPQSAASQNYNLRHRTHDRQLHQHQGHLSDCNFITRLLYKNSH